MTHLPFGKPIQHAQQRTSRWGRFRLAAAKSERSHLIIPYDAKTAFPDPSAFALQQL